MQNPPPHPENELPRGEVFDIELDENGRIREAPSEPKTWHSAWFFVGLAILLATYNFGAYVGQRSRTPMPVGPFTSQDEKLKPIRLQVAGRVKKPGVYTLPGGARIEDAVKKAGGALPGADLQALNLADWALDGSKIQVPARVIAQIQPTPTPVVIIKEVFVTPPQNTPAEVALAAPPRPIPLSEPEVAATEAATKKTPVKAKPRGKSSADALILLKRNPVDLNRATATQLSVLPGVGPKMAERILLYRRENGGFKSVADLDNVKGIGEKRMETLRDLVKVN